MPRRKKPRTTVYRMYGKRRRFRRQLLYVGITSNPKRRNGEHRVLKPWFSDVKRTRMKRYRTRRRAAMRELKLIRSKRPKYNIAGRRPT